MGTTTVSTLIARAQTLLQDTSGVRWPQDELIKWLDDAQREVVLHRPEASASTVPMKLKASTTMQSIPDGTTVNSTASSALSAGVSFIKATRNMGVTGAAAGRAIRIVSREIMDAQNPGWHFDAPFSTGATVSDGVKHYIYDPLDPKTFYVYPPAPATAWYIELVYAKKPAALTTTSNAIAVDDIFANAMLDYTLFRAYSKDAEYAQNAQLAMAYYTAFANAVGLSYSTTQSRNPNVLDGGMNPNVPKK